jgi:hypothetical protein
VPAEFSLETNGVVYTVLMAKARLALVGSNAIAPITELPSPVAAAFQVEPPLVDTWICGEK